jgi:hypothetical protein
VVVGEGSRRAPFSLRLDVRERSAGRWRLLGRRAAPSAGPVRPKLFHYISAGGMRQLRRTGADDLVDARRRSFLSLLFWLGLAWVFFYFLPCG